MSTSQGEVIVALMAAAAQLNQIGRLVLLWQKGALSPAAALEEIANILIERAKEDEALLARLQTAAEASVIGPASRGPAPGAEGTG
jgi:hypothetical protein